MITLRPTFRVFRREELVVVEALHNERASPISETALVVIRALKTPVENAPALSLRLQEMGTVVERGEIHATLSLLSGLGLIDTKDTSVDDTRAALFSSLAAGMPSFPLVDQVELTNICPMTCVMCPTGTGAMTRQKGRMADDVFMRLVDEVVLHDVQRAHRKPLTLHNLGESLLHPSLPRFIAYAHERGLDTEVAGNPGHLAPALYDALCDAGLTRLVLDVDGLDQTTLESIRGKGARGDVAFSHLEHVLATRRDRPTHGPVVVVQMIRQHRNAHQCDAFLSTYQRGLARTEVYVKALDANTRPKDDLVHIGGRVQRTLCRSPFKSVVVLWDGTVVPCCHDDNGALALGSLTTDSLSSIWNGAALDELRTRMQRGDVQGTPCDTCAHRPDHFPMPLLTEIPDEPLAW